MLSNVIIGGTQDNGTQYQLSPLHNAWGFLSGGDGGDVAVDNITLAGSNQSIRYSSSQDLGGFRRTTWDASGNLLTTVFPALAEEAGSPDFELMFTTPVATNNVAGSRLLFGEQLRDELTNQGNTIAQVGAAISGFDAATNTTSGIAMDYGGRQGGVDNPDAAYVGTELGKVFVRTTAGGGFMAMDPTTGIFLIRDVVMDTADWRGPSPSTTTRCS